MGWKAYIDGEEVAISRVNYILRSIEIPAGEHKIEFVYDLASLKSSGLFAHLSTVLILLLLAGGLFIEFKGKEELS